MKLIAVLSSVVLCTLSTPNATAQSPTSDGSFDPLGENHDLPVLFRVQAEFIEVSHTALTELLAKPRTSANDTDLRAACAELVKKNEAQILETAIVNAKSGHKTTAESITEYIYPTEWEPPYTSEIHDKKDGKTEITETGNGAPLGTTFDTKNLGCTLEIEPNVGENDKIIDLRISPELIYLDGHSHWGTWESDEHKVEVKAPNFFVLRLSTGITLVSGQPQLVAAMSPKDQFGKVHQDRKIMMFVRADTITVGR